MGMIPLLWVYLHHSWYGEHRPSIGYDILNFCFCFCNLTFSPPGHGESGIIVPLDLFTWVNKSMLTIPLEGRFHCRIKCCVTISMSMPYCEQHDWLDHCHFVVIVQIFLAMVNRDFCSTRFAHIGPQVNSEVPKFELPKFCPSSGLY